MLSNSNGINSFNTKTSRHLSPISSYADFDQDDDDINNDHAYSLIKSIPVQQQPTSKSKHTNPSLPALDFSAIKDSALRFFTEKDDAQESRSNSVSPLVIITSNRAQQTSPSEMFPITNNPPDTNKNHVQHRQHLLKRSSSADSIIKRSSSEEHTSVLVIDDEEEEPRTPQHERKNIPITNRTEPIPKIQYSHKTPSPMIKNGKSPALKWNSSVNTPRPAAVIPSITQRAIHGVLVNFFRIGDAYHRGLKVAVNEFVLKSWEAFLNYLNRQPKLVLSTGGINHIYSLIGEEIHSISQFQHHHSYVVSTGGFFRTNYHWIDHAFIDDFETSLNLHPQQGSSLYWNARSSVNPRWRSPQPSSSLSSTLTSEQIYLLPYSKLNMYESLILNRNITQTFDEWLQDHITDLLSHYTNNENITNLFAVLNSTFIEVKSFSKLFNIMKTTDTFIACTQDEYTHAKNYFEIIKPNELFKDRKSTNNKPKQQYPSKRAIDDVKLSINWIHGYNGENELTKKLYTLPENEILYVIDSICILYETNLKQQRYYTKHNSSITSVNIHQSQSLVASSEISSVKNNQRALVHIWDHVKLETVREIHKEQFGSFISLLSFSPKPDDNLLLIISRDKPKIILFIDWKRNELIYSITCKSDNILSVLFVFDTTEWIACISQRHLLFYHVNWSLRPLRMLERRESEVQNIYTGAAACDSRGERLLVGDEVGNIYVWSLIDKEPKLVTVQECLVENDVEIIISINHETFLLANKQNQIKFWNVKSDTTEQIRLNENMGSLQSVCCIRRASSSVTLAIGTKLNYIISKEIGNEQFNIIMRGHTSPTTCICCDNDSHYFFSISSDRHLFKWNDRTKSVEWSTKSTQPISCADLHPQRNIIVLGTEISKLIIYDTLSSFYITTITLKFNTGVKSVRFSPDGLNLAVGLHNGNVCIFDVIGNGDFHLRTDGILQNDTAAVNSVIWSVDTKYLLAIYTDNDYNIWTLPSFEINRAKKLHNIEWDRIVHPIMCNVLDKSTIDTHISAINLSSNLVLCCGKDGQLRLFQNDNEHNSQLFQFGLGSIHSIVASPIKNTYLLSLTDNPTIVEIQININNSQ
ncbi:unnamed protein product [Adineta steineri]|uniref:Doublecortin domain-containing protein n=1 Tax=Adineta steineri TaxID=433720 RepID=A0A813VYI5_9BILA|nr:unnamed protein product [Adineta steineri]CAF3610441.1 unnamed protein product [Adineta steineri]